MVDRLCCKYEALGLVLSTKKLKEEQNNNEKKTSKATRMFTSEEHVALCGLSLFCFGSTCLEQYLECNR